MANNLLDNNPLWVVDVGASGGVDPRWGEFTGSYRGVLFEPDPREYDLLKARSQDNLIVLNAALSDSAGTVDFYLCQKQEVSSAFLPNFEFLRKFPDADRFNVTQTIQVQTDTLDNQLKASGIEEIDFVKVDTQGCELPILRGGSECLGTVVGLELEVEFAELYTNQPLFSELDSYVRAKGFSLFDLKRYFWKRLDGAEAEDQKGQLVFGDALYFRGPEQVLQMNGLTQNKVLRALSVYLVYGYVDLARALLNAAADGGAMSGDAARSAEAVIADCAKKMRVPKFKGRKKISRALEGVLRVLGGRGGWHVGTDRSLGNP